MSIQFVWDESYSVGDDDIDAQHQSMFALANTLPETLDKKAIDRIVMQLYRHTRTHFTDEENMMKAIGYPKLKDHCELHEELITKLNKVSRSHFENDQAVLDFKKFIYDWIIDHIMNHDMDYFRFTKCDR